MFKEYRNLYVALSFLIFVSLFGTIGYMIIEDFSFLEALYMTILTMSTVGFKEVRPLSEPGMVFTVVLIVSSLGLIGYIVTYITRAIIDGDYRKMLRNIKQKNKIKTLKDHIIICGLGRNGRQAAKELLKINEKVVIIESDPELLNKDINEEFKRDKNFIFVHGDASHEESLFKANPTEAKALITTLPNDADNLLIILTARDINTRMLIISRASDEHSYSKLKRAGADNVIMPDIVGGTRMAKMVSEPNVIEFLEMIALREGVDVNIDEIACDDLASCFVDSTISDLDIRKKTGANIIGLKQENGEYIFNPSGSIKLKQDDRLFVLGTVNQIDELKSLLESGHYFDNVKQ
jgi:voltage-gated potassium channel